MDVYLPEGTTYILVIDTDAYAGNFESLLCGYATGIYDEEGHRGKEEAKAAYIANPDVVKALLKKSKSVHHYEYGEVTNTIRATSENSDYESVAIFFKEPLTKQEMDFVSSRAHEYASLNSFTVKDVYVVEAVLGPVIEKRLPQ